MSIAFDAHKNFSYSTVLTAPSPASSGTSLVVQSGDGAKFPAVPFNVTIWAAGANPITTNAEIATVTNVSTDTFTIVRAAESSSARTVVVGDQIAATITKKTLTDIENIVQIFQTEVDFGTTPLSEQTFTITDANVTTSSHLIAELAYEAPTGKDLDELQMDELVVICAPASGSFDMYIRSGDGSYLADKFKINYRIG